MDLSEALRKLDLQLLSEGKSQNTRRAYQSDVQQFWASMTPEDIRVELADASHLNNAVRAYIDHHRATMSPATLNRRLASLRALARVLGFPRPLDGYRMPSPGVRPAHPLPDGMTDLKAMLAACTNREQWVLVALCGGCGARVSEARGVTPRDFSNVGGQVHVRLFGKGSKERFVPVADLAWKYLERSVVFGLCDEQTKNKPIIKLSDRGARKAITTIGQRAGVSRPVASHDLRMTFGTAVYRSSHDIRATQQLLGHASSVTTERYTLISDDAKLAAIKGVA